MLLRNEQAMTAMLERKFKLHAYKPGGVDK